MKRNVKIARFGSCLMANFLYIYIYIYIYVYTYIDIDIYICGLVEYHSDVNS